MEWGEFVRLLEDYTRDAIAVARAYFDLIENPEFDEPVAVQRAYELMEKKRPYAAMLVRETLGRQVILSKEYEYLSAAGC